MQFHLNGFRPGDPEILEPTAAASSGHDALPDALDVLIVGCGPAGLTLAAQLVGVPRHQDPHRRAEARPAAARPGRRHRLPHGGDVRGFRLQRAHPQGGATGSTRRRSGSPTRTSRTASSATAASRTSRTGCRNSRTSSSTRRACTTSICDVMRNSPTRLEPDYSRRASSISRSTPRRRDYPVTVTLERLDAAPRGQIETVKARYVVGCDGARSVVRRSLGRALHGDSANQAWGVMDVLAVTDFPDIRLKAAIQSANEGNILIIPREGGYLVRIYIELDKLDDERTRREPQHHARPSHRRGAANPASLHARGEGDRVVVGLRDRPAALRQVRRRAGGGGGHALPRVFIAGDACHTHSPKAGQGMNVSMQDGFNLGWKLASVLRGRCPPQLLHTYSAERQARRQGADRLRPRMGQDVQRRRRRTRPTPDSEGVDPDGVPGLLRQARALHGRVRRRTTAPSIISAEPTHQHLAKGFAIGMRFHSAPVIRLADAKPVQLGHTVKADGRWRLFAFADAEDPAQRPRARHARSAHFLADSPDSPLRKYTPSGADIDCVIDVRARSSSRAIASSRSRPCRRCCCRARAATACATTRRCSAPT